MNSIFIEAKHPSFKINVNDIHFYWVLNRQNKCNVHQKQYVGCDLKVSAIYLNTNQQLNQIIDLYQMKVAVLLLTVATVSSLTKYHKRLLLGCRSQCLTEDKYERVTPSPYPDIYPLKDTTLALNYSGFDHNLLVYRKIGQGATAQVYLMQDPNNNEFKILKRYLEPNQQDLETQNLVMHTLKQPIDWSEQPQFNYPVSIHPYRAARILSGVIYSQSDIKIVMYKLISSLHQAHYLGIIHNDIKPANILIDSVFEKSGYLTSRAITSLIDWNLAQFYYEGKKLNTEGRGTAGYRAPEIVLGAQYYSPTVDVWSLGVTMFEVTTGKRFMSANNDNQAENFVKMFGYENWTRLSRNLGTKTNLNLVQQAIKHSKTTEGVFESRLNKYHLAVPQQQFIKRMLVLDPFHRPSLWDLLYDPYFHDIKHLERPKFYKYKQKGEKIPSFSSYSGYYYYS